MFHLVFVERHRHTEVRQHVHLQCFVVLVFLMRRDERLAKVVHHVVDIDLQTLAKQGVVTFLVDSLTLHVHHVVVVQEVLTYAEVVLFDLLLCLLDLFRYHRMLNHLAFLHSETVHDRRYALGAEDTHEVVFQ